MVGLPTSNFRFIRERPLAIPSFNQKCLPPESAAPGHCSHPALVGALIWPSEQKAAQIYNFGRKHQKYLAAVQYKIREDYLDET